MSVREWNICVNFIYKFQDTVSLNDPDVVSLNIPSVTAVAKARDFSKLMSMILEKVNSVIRLNVCIVVLISATDLERNSEHHFLSDTLQLAFREDQLLPSCQGTRLLLRQAPAGSWSLYLWSSGLRWTICAHGSPLWCDDHLSV